MTPKERSQPFWSELLPEAAMRSVRDVHVQQPDPKATFYAGKALVRMSYICAPTVQIWALCRQGPAVLLAQMHRTELQTSLATFRDTGCVRLSTHFMLVHLTGADLA